ncbi:MAG TPA: hypothetical protein VKA09_10095 [Nitrososphaeraceae archaeon]|nr:hypothetical protein [Nitrososphaeraceae archaeon]
MEDKIAETSETGAEDKVFGEGFAVISDWRLDLTVTSMLFHSSRVRYQNCVFFID